MRPFLPLFFVLTLMQMTAVKARNCSDIQCKEWAECAEINGTSYCVCDGRAGPQCQEGSDPCLNHLCANGATCVNRNDQPNCLCAESWIGNRCQLRDPCQESNACGPNGLCKAVAANNVEGIAYILMCDCRPGWKGSRCDQAVALTKSFPYVPTVTGFIILSVAIALLSLGVIYVLHRKRQQLKAMTAEKFMNYTVSFHPQSSTVHVERLPLNNTNGQTESSP